MGGGRWRDFTILTCRVRIAGQSFSLSAPQPLIHIHRRVRTGPEPSSVTLAVSFAQSSDCPATPGVGRDTSCFCPWARATSGSGEEPRDSRSLGVALPGLPAHGMEADAAHGAGAAVPPRPAAPCCPHPSAEPGRPCGGCAHLLVFVSQ